jgi:hypothetical protein
VIFYPNPVSDLLTIKTNEDNFLVELRDLSGKLIMTNENSSQIDLSEIEKGIYMIVYNSTRQKVTKIIVK